MLGRQHSHWRIVTHGGNSFLAAFSQWTQNLVALFKRHLKHLHIGLYLFAAQRTFQLNAVHIKA